MRMNDFAKEVHQNAVEHGWWEEARSCGEIIALCHSELSEALEEYRAKRPMVWAKDDDGTMIEDLCEIAAKKLKPEGIAVELADCIIRILDWFGEERLSADELMMEAARFMYCDVPRRLFSASLGDYIARWHLLLSLGFSCWCRATGTQIAAVRMALCINEINEWAAERQIDMDAILNVKHEYNKGRPYRHGGKAL